MAVAGDVERTVAAPPPVIDPPEVSSVLLDGLYRRAGARYMWSWATFGCVAAIPFPLTAAVFITWFRPSVGATQFAELVAIGSVVVLLAVLASFLGSFRHARVIHRWLQGGRRASEAAAARAAAVSLPWGAVRGAMAAGLSACPVAAILVGEVLDFGFLGDLVVFFAGAVTAIWAGVLAYFTGELFMQPVLWDTAARMPPGTGRSIRRVSLGRKLFWAMIGIGLLTSTGSALLASHGGRVGHLAVGLASSAVITTIVSSALTMLVVRSAVAPIHHLTDVTERVRGGDLSVRAHTVSADELADLSDSLNAMLDGLRDRAVLHEAFGSYVDRDVADRILREGQVLGATSGEATILFVDIVGFTEFSERVTPADAVERLERFFQLIVPIVERHDGRVNKFVGDGLVAVFGLPSVIGDDADRALGAALQIASAVRREFGGELSIGMGINSGPIAAGSVGGGGRYEYMLIGDPVNVASRVERLTRATGDEILITDATRARLTVAVPGLQRRGEITVKGKRTPLRVFAVIDEPS